MQSPRSELELEQVDSMQWNRTIARQVLDESTQLKVTFPRDVDPAVVEKVREQIKQQVLEDGAEAEEKGFGQEGYEAPQQ